MARLNITIPDDLYAALERWRDRLNISKICQDAIAKEVAKLEDLPRQAAELEALVERLREEKDRAERRYFAQGMTDGIAQARGMSYRELRRWAVPDSGGGAAGGDSGVLLTALRRYGDEPTFDEHAYIEGWKVGVGEVWQRVKDKV